MNAVTLWQAWLAIVPGWLQIVGGSLAVWIVLVSFPIMLFGINPRDDD